MDFIIGLISSIGYNGLGIYAVVAFYVPSVLIDVK